MWFRFTCNTSRPSLWLDKIGYLQLRCKTSARRQKEIWRQQNNTGLWQRKDRLAKFELRSVQPNENLLPLVPRNWEEFQTNELKLKNMRVNNSHIEFDLVEDLEAPGISTMKKEWKRFHEDKADIVADFCSSWAFLNDFRWAIQSRLGRRPFISGVVFCRSFRNATKVCLQLSEESLTGDNSVVPGRARPLRQLTDDVQTDSAQVVINGRVWVFS
jgi:hypothetical protein